MSDHIHDTPRAEREHLRWILLAALWHATPYGCNEQILVRIAQDVPLRVTPDRVRRELAYLRGCELVEVDESNPLWHAEITAKGSDVVDYRADAPAGVARPPKW